MGGDGITSTKPMVKSSSETNPHISQIKYWWNSSAHERQWELSVWPLKSQKCSNLNQQPICRQVGHHICQWRPRIIHFLYFTFWFMFCSIQHKVIQNTLRLIIYTSSCGCIRIKLGIVVFWHRLHLVISHVNVCSSCMNMWEVDFIGHV